MESRRGAHVCAEVTKAAKRELEVLDRNAFLGLASSFELFGQDHLVRIQRQLKSARVLSDLQVAVSPLCVAYPKCPLAGLVRGTDDLERSTAQIRRALSSLLDRWDEPATFVQIHAVYMAFLQGRFVYDPRGIACELPGCGGIPPHRGIEEDCVGLPKYYQHALEGLVASQRDVLVRLLLESWVGAGDVQATQTR